MPDDDAPRFVIDSFVIRVGLLALIGFPLLRLFVRKYRHRRTLKFGPFLALGGLFWILFSAAPFFVKFVQKLQAVLR